MPEGDSIAKNVAQLSPVLARKEIVSIDGTSPSIRSNSHRLLGKTVEAVRSVGKHLVIDVSGGFSLRIHLGMPGRWSILPADQKAPGSARLVLTTDSHHAACFSAPTVEVDRTPAIDHKLSRLGPDILDPTFEPDDFIHRARARRSRPIADVLLDQRVIAGIGNVYKSELLFLTGIHPQTPVEEISDRLLGELAERGVGLMSLNVRSGPRVTTGEMTPGRQVWVYDRAGRPCRRCSTAIEGDRVGDRITYWCPSCQPA